MPFTGQTAVNKMRVHLQEIDPLNSRWEDSAHLLPYLLEGRREFAKLSFSVKAEFTRTIGVGITVGNPSARYSLDPTLLEIDNAFFDGEELDPVGRGELQELVGPDPAEIGYPQYYSRFGDSIEIYKAPDRSAVLMIQGSVMPVDIGLLDVEIELNDDQVQGAIDFAVARTLEDDNRDGSIYRAQFHSRVKFWKKTKHHKGPRHVQQYDNRWDGAR